MKIFRSLVFVAFVLIAPSSASAGQSRTRVMPGEAVVVWSREPVLAGFTHEWYGQPDYTLTGPDGKRVPLTRRPTWDGQNEAPFDLLHHGEVAIPADAKPGKYVLTSGAGSFNLEVVKSRVRAGRHRLNPGATVAEARKWLDKGYDLVLDPGEYRWGRSVFQKFGVDLPLNADGAWVYGPGAVILPDPSGGLQPPAEPWQLAGFFSASGATLEGLAFDLGGGRAVGSVYSENLTLRRCRLLGTSVSEPGAGLRMEECEVTGRAAGVYVTGGALVRATRFHDTTDSHPFACGRVDGDAALVGCSFDRVGRGPLFQPNGGGFRGFLALGTVLRDVRSYNGSESFAVENGSGNPNAFTDALIFHTLSDTEGSSVQWDGPAFHNLVRDFTVRRGLGFRLWGAGVRDNTFVECMAGNPKVELGPGAANNTFDGVVRNPTPLPVEKKSDK